MKQILKSLLRYKTSTILNLIGLSTAFAVFILVMMQLKYDLTYDKWAKDHEQIHLLAYYDDNWKEEDFHLSRNFETLYNGVPQLGEVGVSIWNWYYGDSQLFFVENSQDNIFEGIPSDCNKRFIEIFSLEFIEGGLDEFENPSSIVISEDIAKKISDSSVIGKSITNSETKKNYQIVGVFKSIPKNSSMVANMFTYIGNQGFNSKYNASYSFFAKIDPSVPMDKLNDQIYKINIKEEKIKKEDQGKGHMRPKTYKIKEISKALFGFNNNQIYILLLIGIATISIALINFINFTISMIPLKIKSINLRRVVGASKK